METLDNLSFDDLVPSESKYLKKEDCGEGGLIVTIKGFSHETLKGDHGDEQKVALHFEEDVKPLILNRTNSQLLKTVTGNNIAKEAKGKQIVVYNDPTISFGDRIVGGVRIKSANTAAPVAAAPVREPGTDDEPNDPIPF